MGDVSSIMIVAKVFERQDCITYRCKTPDEMRNVPDTLEAICSEGVQIVVLNDPEIYSEYTPCRYIDELWEFISSVKKLKAV